MSDVDKNENENPKPGYNPDWRPPSALQLVIPQDDQAFDKKEYGDKVKKFMDGFIDGKNPFLKIDYEELPFARKVFDDNFIQGHGTDINLEDAVINFMPLKVITKKLGLSEDQQKWLLAGALLSEDCNVRLPMKDKSMPGFTAKKTSPLKVEAVSAPVLNESNIDMEETKHVAPKAQEPSVEVNMEETKYIAPKAQEPVPKGNFTQFHPVQHPFYLNKYNFNGPKNTMMDIEGFGSRVMDSLENSGAGMHSLTPEDQVFGMTAFQDNFGKLFGQKGFDNNFDNIFIGGKSVNNLCEGKNMSDTQKMILVSGFAAERKEPIDVVKDDKLIRLQTTRHPEVQPKSFLQNVGNLVIGAAIALFDGGAMFGRARAEIAGTNLGDQLDRDQPAKNSSLQQSQKRLRMINEEIRARDKTSGNSKELSDNIEKEDVSKEFSPPKMSAKQNTNNLDQTVIIKPLSGPKSKK